MKNSIYILLFLIGILQSCQDEFLEKKSDKSLLVPSTLSDFQNLLDNLDVFNIMPSLHVIASDDYFGIDTRINSFSSIPARNSYLWTEDIFEGASTSEWSTPYQQVFYANVVLDGLENLLYTSHSKEEYDEIKGAALFHRAFAFYNTSQMFAKSYDETTADQDLGIPIRLEADVNLRSNRGTLQQTYNQIISDLKEAENLLPLQSAFQTRPNKNAVRALLARVYLNMEDYENALTYSKKCLDYNSTLIDFNTLSTAATVPFPAAPNNQNIEIIFYAVLTGYTFGVSTQATVDDDLYNMYSPDDLRRSIFFSATNPAWFKGRYTGSSLRLFGGLATDEMFLIKAECEARIGSHEQAMNDLNTLLKSRWSNAVTYPILTALDKDDALKQILEERRKELLFRGLRWGDLRRLNKDSRFAVTLIRILNNHTYILLPNSNRYTFPIPTPEIELSGLEQNPR